MKRLVHSLTEFINENNPNLTELQLKKISFGLECLLSELSKLLIYLIIFWIFSLTEYYLIAVIFFAITRSTAGGYHEDTYIRCLITTFLLLIAIITLSIKTNFYPEMRIGLVLFSMIIALIFAPVDHPNKPIISKRRRTRMKYISVVTFGFMGVLSFLLPEHLENTAQLSIFFTSLTLIVGYYKNLKTFNT
jgi:accessory gene regulator B